MPKIELINVSKRWGNFVAVDKLSMVIDDREFITLLGPSGCGKTTTLRMIAGLETPTEGVIKIGDTVVFDSENGINVSPSKRDVGFLFQNYALWPHMTVYQNIAFGLENMKWRREDVRARVDEMLKMLKIEQFEHRYPSELSGGQQQRVAIARTLAPKPKVLFMDEPLSNLDAKLRLEMRTELKRLHADTDSTFVYVTHDQLEAMTLATRVCLLDEGILQQYDPPLVVYNRPSNMFVADFVGNPTMNFIEAKATASKDGADVEFFGLKGKFVSDELNLEGSEVILGVRPECIILSKEGDKRKGAEAQVFASLPAGMETTVKLEIGGNILTSVVFGSVDYAINEKVGIEVVSQNIVMFDKATRKAIGMGSLKV
jgi:multiple sugar transport system ATP-binding protein